VCLALSMSFSIKRMVLSVYCRKMISLG
jgi:hypothetical protein